jgi:hypothetical protein
VREGVHQEGIGEEAMSGTKWAAIVAAVAVVVAWGVGNEYTHAAFNMMFGYLNALHVNIGSVVLVYEASVFVIAGLSFFAAAMLLLFAWKIEKLEMKSRVHV